MKHKIMIVDDSEMMNQFLNVVLQTMGQTHPFSSSQKALEMIESGFRPDIIVLDLDMPEISGLDFLAHLRVKGLLENIEVLILSAKDESSFKIKCLDYGASDFLTKPFHPKELRLRIQKILDRNYLSLKTA